MSSKLKIYNLSNDLYNLHVAEAPEARKILQTRVRCRCLDCVFCSLTHRYIEPGARARLQNLSRRRSASISFIPFVYSIYSKFSPNRSLLTTETHQIFKKATPRSPSPPQRTADSDYTHSISRTHTPARTARCKIPYSAP